MSEETEALAERLRREVKERNKEPDYFDHGVTQDMSDAADAIELLISSQARLSEAVKVLEWYGEQARLCRLIHSEGDAGRNALSEDGGKKAKAFLATLGEDNEGA